MKLRITIVMALLFIQMTSASIISINSGGSTNVVTIPTREIEGFFFGTLNATTSEGIHNPQEKLDFDTKAVCRSIEDFVTDIYTVRLDTGYTNQDLREMQAIIRNRLGVNVPDHIIRQIILEDCDFTIGFDMRNAFMFLIFVAILFVVVLSIWHRKRIFYFIILKKRRKK